MAPPPDEGSPLADTGLPSGVASIYDFHGLYRVRVAHRALDALMRRELGQFLNQGDGPDLTITEGSVNQLAHRLPDQYSFDESAFVVQAESGRIAIRNGGILAE